MGLLIDGEWIDQWYDTKSNDGKFKRELSSIRRWVGDDDFPAESERYHLYVSLACPWAHRTLIFRKLKQLEAHISFSIVSPDMLTNGWSFCINEGSSGDVINHVEYLHEIYTLHDVHYTGRVTVPVLWDKKNRVIVNNESADIIRMLNQSFNHLTSNQDNYYPEHLQNAINDMNTFIYDDINNGVYRCGFATTQHAYEQAYHELFNALDKVEAILQHNRYLLGSQITEADWRLFTTLIRFDMVYYGHFKCNKQRIEDYPHLSEYVRELYQWPGIMETVNFQHIKRHYYYSHTMINPTQVVPLGPMVDFLRAYKRDL